MKIVVIDGQGGNLGKALVESLKKSLPECSITAIGTNSAATASMRKAGADCCATGENPVVVACADADIIAGPMGIIAANSLLGEITPAMALAVGASKALKVLIPISKCRIAVAGVCEAPYSEYVRLAVERIKQLVEEI